MLIFCLTVIFYKGTRMKRIVSLALSSLILVTPLSCSTESMDAASSEKKAVTKKIIYRNAVKKLGGALKSELVKAMKAGGPIEALSICNEKAPVITTQISEQLGFKITRTSLKPRNADNAPDEWETKVLNDFEKRKANGEDPNKLEFIELVEQKKQTQWRYMKALPTAEVCLICHGSNISTEINAKIKELYKDDKATGFKVGDLRGAFSITETMK